MNARISAIGLVLSLLASGCGQSGADSDPVPSESVAQRAGAVLGDASEPIPIVAPAEQSGALALGESRYWQLTVPANHDGLRVAVSCPQQCDVFLRRNAAAGGTTIGTKYNGSLNTLFVQPGATIADSNWFLEIHADADGAFALRIDPAYALPLTWDDGSTFEGLVGADQPDQVGGDYLFAMAPQDSTWGAWRNTLWVNGGEADLYMAQNSLPSLFSSWRSEKPGSDAVVLPYNSFSSTQTWYLLVHAEPNSTWNLVSGDVFVHDLGELGPCCSGSHSLQVGPDETAWARTTVPTGTQAWILAATGGPASLYVDSTVAPVPSYGYSYDKTSEQRMLLVPNYLVDGEYLVAVAAAPGTIGLRSYQHRIEVPSAQPGYSGADEFTFDLASQPIDAELGYRTFQLDVPVDQIAWQVVLSQAEDFDLYVRQGEVPNETYNHGLAEAVAVVDESVTLVPPTLTNGTWYVTVKGTSGAFGLTSGNPEVTDIAFVNDPTPVPNGSAYETLAGWRYYRVPDIASQLGSLGWILELSAAVPGTEIAIRKNAVPGRWRYRQNGSTTVYNKAHTADDSITGFLERAEHEADVWYVGVYQPEAPLGAFELTTRTFQPENVPFNQGDVTVLGQPDGRWRYFRTVVPPEAQGWEVRLTDVTAGSPKMVIRRDELAGALTNSPSGSFQIYGRHDWSTGWQWAPGTDMTGRNYGPYVQGVPNVDVRGRVATMGLGSPLEPGTYFIGVTSAAPGDMTYTLTSRGIGAGADAGGTPWAIPVTELGFSDSVSASGLAPGEIRYYHVEVPANTESWEAHLQVTSGEAMMAIRRDTLPNSEAGYKAAPSDSPSYWSGTRRQKDGDEHFYKYPGHSEAELTPGDYFIAVASEGVSPYSSGYFGSGAIDFTLHSVGEVALQGGAGTVVQPGAPLAWLGHQLEYGEQRAYRFTVPAGVINLEVRLENVTGAPTASIQVEGPTQSSFPDPAGDGYGAAEGGYSYLDQSTALLSVASPQGTYTVIVATNHGGSAQSPVPSQYDLQVVALGESTVAFNGGTEIVAGQTEDSWRYFVVDVPDGALGWDVRLEDVVGAPRMVIRRDELPGTLSNFPGGSFQIYGRSEWQSGWQWAPGTDLTNRGYAPYVQGVSSMSEQGRRVSMGVGSPLEAGTYRIGVHAGTAGTASYTLQSRGIGMGDDAGGTPWSIQVEDLPFEGTVDAADIAPREIRYYRVELPAGAKSWEVELHPSVGEAMMALRKGALPNAEAGYKAADSDNGNYFSGARRQKNGSDFFYKYAPSQQAELTAGTWYIAVASEGTDPHSTSYIGLGATSYSLQSKGEVDIYGGEDQEVTAGQSLEWLAQSLQFGQQRTYQFSVPPGVTSLEVRLENVTGDPNASLLLVEPDLSPFPNPAGEDYAASEGGRSYLEQGPNILTLTAPLGIYTVTVVAGHGGSVANPVDSQYDLRVVALGQTVVPFNGGTSDVTGQEAGSWRYFEVQVPADAMGWDLRLLDCVGEPKMVIRRDELPESLSNNPGSSYPVYARGEWQSGWQWLVNSDMTNRVYAPYVQGQASNNESGRIVSMGMGSPLQPGTYYVGVYAQYHLLKLNSGNFI